ncbi:AAA family ATPase [Larkinella punicea]|uniref:ATPase n=1 Tax=Larkinella punicea TaxID=2315727 RepID=A0A368JGP1_9BACT|nr:AAA family ATPase [Larkinella punicea]RCR65713.1 ATPase [Larkinella punicea]
MESTNNFLNWVEIKNFKSIKDLRLDCKRVNVFIGKPNVGKSNILEALGLLGANYSRGKFMEGFIRYKELKHLYRDGDIHQTIQILSDQQVAILYSYVLNSQIETAFRFWISSFSTYKYILDFGKHYADLSNDKNTLSMELQIDGKFNRFKNSENENFNNIYNTVKKYDFTNLTEFENLFQEFLLPPQGPNLYEVIRRNKDLWGEFAKLFTDQQLELVLFDAEQEFILQKKQGPYVTQYPFFSIADTFRRFMFYITAVESNKDSVIVLEEPEVHSFPPYTQELAYRIIYNTDNQFFISTHSPYLLHTFIENLEEDQLNVFVTYYENYETKVHALTTEDLRHILDFSTDVFFNLDKFIPNAGRSVSA